MTKEIDKLNCKIDEMRENISNFQKLFDALEPGYIEIMDEQSRKAVGLLTRRRDYEIYELDLPAGFCTIHHQHTLAYENHLIISGEVNIKQGGMDNFLSAGGSITTAKGVEHTFVALTDTKIITIAVPTLKENDRTGEKGC